MKENNVETGRSMLETLAVLAIIMVITIASIAGFDYLVQYRNRMETVKTVDLLVTSIKSGDLGRRRAQSNPNEVWDAGEIVKGPEINDQTLVLPDSEHSYAVVRTLKNGGWVMAMQINPKTCEEMVKSLAAQGATVYRMLDTEGDALGAVTKTEAQNDPGKLSLESFKKLSARSVLRLADDKETDVHCTIEGEGPDELEDCRWGVNLKYMTEECAGEGEAAEKCQASKAKANARLNKIIQACKGGSGNAADSEEVVAGYLLGAVAVCPGSVSGDSNFVGYDSCGRCIGGVATKNDTCCDPKQVCGDVCNCKHPVRDGQTCYCADCDTSPENDYDALYCKKTYGYYRQHVCIGENGSEHCGECSLDEHCQMDYYTPADYKDAANYNKFKHADDQYYMYCVDKNKCRECNHDFDDKLTYTDDDTAYSDGDGNAYCPVRRPYCSEAGFCEGGCKDSQKGGNTDWGCETDPAHLCMPDKDALRNYNNGQGATGTACRLCFDSHPDEATRDDGCIASARPLCAPGSDDGKYGNTCYHCQRQAWANDADRDLGCEGADGKNICPASNDDDQSFAGGYSNAECVPCIDDQPGVDFEPKNEDDHPDIAVDRGCGGQGSNNLLCEPRNMEGFDIRSPQNKIGQACRLCYNDKPDGLYDIGCTEFGKPNCKASQGAFGDVCEASSGPVTPTCMDDQTGSTRDSGCPMAGEGADQMLCVPEDSPDTNGPAGSVIYTGKQCKKCFNNNADDKADDGCDEDAAGPLCDAAQSHYGDSCHLCQRGTTTGELFTSADLGCAGYSNKPVCNGSSAGDYGTACVRCKDDAVNGNVDMGCQIGSKTGGLCNAATHTIGTATGHFSTACMKCYNDKSDDGDDSVANRDVGCTDGDNLYCDANLHSYGNNCVSEPPSSKICKAYVMGESAPYTEMNRADCQRLFGHACTPTDCPTMVIHGDDTHACLCSEPEPENPCPDGYYGRENGQNPFEIGDTKAACEASSLAQQYQDLCADTNCPAQTYNDLQVCMCAVPPVTPCSAGYYYKNQQGNIAEVDDDDLRKYGLTPAVCPKQTITYEGHSVENACVCDLRCADGYYAYDGSEYNGPLSSTDPICQDNGGCNKTNTKFEWKEIPDAENACVIEIDVSCQGCLDEAGRCIDTEYWSDIEAKNGKCACKEQAIIIPMDSIRWPSWANANCTDGKGIRGNDKERVYYVDANGKEHAQYKKDGDISAKTVHTKAHDAYKFYCEHKVRIRADVVDDYVVNSSFGVGNCARNKVAGYGTACTNVQKDGFKSDYDTIEAGTELSEDADFSLTVADMYLCVTNVQNARVKIYAGTLPSPEKQAELAQQSVLRRDLNAD